MVGIGFSLKKTTHSRRQPMTWDAFKCVFSTIWLSSPFKVDVITNWRNLKSSGCGNIEEYSKKFQKALFPSNAFMEVLLREEVEAHTCGLPKELQDYMVKNKVYNITQMIEIVQTRFTMLTGKGKGFKLRGNSLTKTMVAKAKESKDSKDASKKKSTRSRF